MYSEANRQGRPKGVRNKKTLGAVGTAPPPHAANADADANDMQGGDGPNDGRGRSAVRDAPPPISTSSTSTATSNAHRHDAAAAQAPLGDGGVLDGFDLYENVADSSMEFDWSLLDPSLSAFVSASPSLPSSDGVSQPMPPAYQTYDALTLSAGGDDVLLPRPLYEVPAADVSRKRTRVWDSHPPATLNQCHTCSNFERNQSTTPKDDPPALAMVSGAARHSKPGQRLSPTCECLVRYVGLISCLKSGDEEQQIDAVLVRIRQAHEAWSQVQHCQLCAHRPDLDVMLSFVLSIRYALRTLGRAVANEAKREANLPVPVHRDEATAPSPTLVRSTLGVYEMSKEEQDTVRSVLIKGCLNRIAELLDAVKVHISAFEAQREKHTDCLASSAMCVPSSAKVSLQSGPLASRTSADSSSMPWQDGLHTFGSRPQLKPPLGEQMPLEQLHLLQLVENTESALGALSNAFSTGSYGCQ